MPIKAFAQLQYFWWARGYAKPATLTLFFQNLDHPTVYFIVAHYRHAPFSKPQNTLVCEV